MALTREQLFGPTLPRGYTGPTPTASPTGIVPAPAPGGLFGTGHTLGSLSGPIGNFVGGFFENRANEAAISGVDANIQQAFAMDPQSFQSQFGSMTFGDGGGQFVGTPQQQAIMQAIQGNTTGALAGQGLQSQFFNQANLGQDPAFMQQQAALAQGFDPSQFDVRDIINQRLSALNQAAAPGETQARQDFLSAAQGSGRGATTGGMKLAEQFGAGQQRAADERILAAEQFGLQTQGQLFGQGLQSHQQNLTAGQTRLSNMLGIFGLGSGALSQDLTGAKDFFGLGQNQQQIENQLFTNTLAQDAARRTSQSNVIGNQIDLLTPQAGQAASTGGGIGGAISTGLKVASMFSDRRLKVEIEPLKTFGDITFYKYHWAPHAAQYQSDLIGPDVGVIAQELMQTHPELVTQDQRSGYYMVDYNGVQEAITNA